MTIVTRNSLTLSNVNDGTITHTAYAYSSDGTDRFTTIYPNLNLLDGTKDFSGNWKRTDGWTTDGTYNGLTVKKRTAQWNGIYKTFTVPKDGTYTFSAYIKSSVNTAKIYRYGGINGQDKGEISKYMANDFDWTRDSVTLNLKANDSVNVRYEISGNGTDSILWTAGHKWEEGSTATPWMPSSSEVKTSDYPSYRGEYSDSNVESSLDYKKYQWAIFKGQNSNAYTAYSWSSDGTDRFSTTYPNLNLLLGSSAKTKDGFFKHFDKVENDYGEITVSETNAYFYQSLFDGFSMQPRDYKPGDKYTMSMDVMFTSWNFPAGTSMGEFWIGQRYTVSDDKTISSWARICYIDLPKDPSQMLNQWIRITQTSIIPPYPDPSVNTHTAFIGQFIGTSKASFTIRIRKPKQEFGSIATPWTPSESEAQDQWQDAIPMYVGVGEKDSQNPTDYRWQLNPRYVQASSDSGLSNKAGVDDLASVADTANDALVKAQNAVSNEDYTSWLEHDYQTTIDDLQDVSIQNQEDIRNVDDRTTAVEGFYDEMKIKWNFIDESFTFSEEGMFISNSQSKMAIQVTSDKIVFWDNDVDVAFITGEILNIQRGVFLESATIGNHLITKFSDDSPVTIITYVGGTN